jgi:hypothetical protein
MFRAEPECERIYRLVRESAACLRNFSRDLRTIPIGSWSIRSAVHGAPRSVHAGDADRSDRGSLRWAGPVAWRSGHEPVVRRAPAAARYPDGNSQSTVFATARAAPHRGTRTALPSPCIRRKVAECVVGCTPEAAVESLSRACGDDRCHFSDVGERPPRDTHTERTHQHPSP